LCPSAIKQLNTTANALLWLKTANAFLCHYNHCCGNEQPCWVKKVIMSTTPVSNITSPDQNAKEPEQSNEVRKKVKYSDTEYFFKY
jgi:hypothetical protein